MFLANLKGAIRDWYRAWRDTRMLCAYSDRHLDDIGLTRCECCVGARSRRIID